MRPGVAAAESEGGEVIRIYSLPRVEGVPDLEFHYGPHERSVGSSVNVGWLASNDPAGDILHAAVALVEAIERARDRSKT